MKLLTIIVLLWASVASGETFTWDAVTDSDLAGYNLYQATGTCAQPQNYVKVITFGKVATGIYTPPVDGPYTWKMKAQDTSGNESITFSNCVEKVVTSNPPAAVKNFAVQ